MNGKGHGEPRVENSEFRAFTLTNLLIVIAFLMPIIGVFAELKHAGSGLLRYSIGLPLSLAAALVIVIAEWQMLKLVWVQAEKHPSKWASVLSVALWFLLVTWSVVAGAKAGDLIAACLIREIH